MNNFKEIVKDNLNINLSDIQIEQFKDYYDFLILTNQKFNLTKITDEKDAYIKHFYDSLLAFKNLNIEKYKTLLDIGSGAGFPGLVLAIAFPNLKIYLVESIGKKANFLKQAYQLLNLENVTVFNERVENLNIKADIITARAVTDTKELLKYSKNIINENGICVFYKSLKFLEEVKQININNQYGFKLISQKEDNLLFDFGKRINVVFEKI